jgi:signal peptidase I
MALMLRRLLLPLSLLLALITALSAPLLRRYVVEGRSMLRTYAPGDRLLVERLTYRLREPRVGDAVVVRQPGSEGRLDLKRIAAAPGSTVTVRGEPVVLGYHEWYVLGDNLSESTDSRTLGPVQRKDIAGKVWRRY